jgi:16S rRNA (adenine1518-N6/adenine1519-N6)-dimethyltransferase
MRTQPIKVREIGGVTAEDAEGFWASRTSHESTQDPPRATLARLNLRPSRTRGQHFLVDERIAERQVDEAALRRTETVLEIGPGLGVLTRRLVERAKRVVAIESDRRLASHLRERLPMVELIEGDAVRVAWPPFDVLVSNLPFQISSPVTFRLLETPFDRAILMYQREFAERMMARPGTSAYSRLTVGVYARAVCELLERVPRNAFHPRPRVDSAIVRLRPRPPPFLIADPALFHAVTEVLFQHRRKTIENGLRLSPDRFGFTVVEMAEAIAAVPHRTRRVGDLRPEEIAEIANAMVMAKG